MTERLAERPRNRRVLTFDRLIVAVLFLALFAMAVRTPADTDVWWHLAAGRAIVTTGRIPYMDQFSFTVNGRPWTDVYWLAQVGMYEARALGGDVALALAVAVLAVVAFVFVYWQMDGAPLLRGFVIVMAATAASVIWSPRPQMLSFALLGVTGYVVYLLKWRRVNVLWVLLPVFVLWGNVHGGYALGLMLIGSVVVGETLNRVTGRGDAPEVMTWKEMGLLAGVGILCGLALLANPYTIGAWTLPFRTVGIKVLQGYIQEWSSPDFHNLYEQPMLWLLFGLLGVVGFSGRRWDWSDLAVVVVFGYSAFLARRNVAPLALVIGPVLTRQLQPIVESMTARVKLPASASQDLNPALSNALNWLILVLVVLAVLVKCSVALSPQMIDKAQQQTLPVRAVEWLKQSGLTGPMYNSYHWGGYLLWVLPEEPVFVDGRTDVYDDEILTEYIKVTFVRLGWQEVLDRYGVRLALVERDGFLATMLATQPEWQSVYSDDQAVIYTRGNQ
jgi:hypothetical protein